jgi:hypothetical protein
VKLVAREDEPHMPPKKPVSKDAAAILAKWIDLGAAYDRPLAVDEATAGSQTLTVTEKDRQYWAYRPLAVVPPPEVKDAKWVTNPIDTFVLAKLEAAKIPPAGDANKRTLIRRVTFDLIGLPPTPEDVEAFVADRTPDAYVASQTHKGRREIPPIPRPDQHRCSEPFPGATPGPAGPPELPCRRDEPTLLTQTRLHSWCGSSSVGAACSRSK